MEVDPQNKQESRKRAVDADSQGQDNEHPDSKSPRINLDIDIKEKVLTYIVKSGLAVYEKLDLCGELMNITVSHQVMSAIQGGHSILRKMANARTSFDHNLSLSATITTNGSSHSISYNEVTKMMREEATRLGLNYTAFNCQDNTDWYGIANPLFHFIAGFKMRYDEIRLGVSRIRVAKRGVTTDYVNISQYGLTPAHHVLLEGSTYKPERRFALAQTLGPLTTMIAAYKSKDPYRNKWIEAVKRDLGHIPKALNLCNALYGRLAEDVAPALRAFADVVLITGSRNVQQAFFPLNFLIYATATQEDLKKYKVNRVCPPLPYSTVDFSGMGMWITYKVCMGAVWILETGMDDISAGQIIYHAIFGTQNKDLGVLQSITDFKNPWRLRSELVDQFKNTGKEKKMIKLPNQRLYSELAQANMTEMHTESSLQIRCKQVFAGKRTVKYMDSFYKHMSGESPQAIQGDSVYALAGFYHRLKIEFMNKEEDHSVNSTEEWRKIEDLDVNSHGSISTETVRESGRYFIGTI